MSSSTPTSTWLKIDLSQLNQTGTSYNIYMLGYACSSGQILQQDPTTQNIVLAPPQASNLTLPSSQFTVSGSQVTLATEANLLVGGTVQFSDGSTSTITGIAASVVCANQPVPNGSFAPYTNPTWAQGANAVILGPASISQGTVSNLATGAQLANVPPPVASAADVTLGALLNGYFTPSGGMPAATAIGSATGTITGFSAITTTGGQYQFPPTVTFPGAGVATVAVGTCTLDSSGHVNGVNITTAGSGYAVGSNYSAVFSSPPGNTYFLPSDANGFPGPTSAASVTSIGVASGATTIGISQATDQPTWAPASPITLGSAALQIYSGGTNASGFATLQSTATSSGLTTANVTIANLPSTSSVQGYDTLLNSAGSSLVVQGSAGSVMIYAVINYTLTLAAPPPAGNISLTFLNSLSGTASADGTALTISTATYPGIVSALALGQFPTISTTGQASVSNLSIASLAVANGNVTITLSSALPAAYQSASVTLVLPPTGGTLPVFQYSSTGNNAVWAQQFPGAAGTMSVNGARIYFVLDLFNYGPPSIGYGVGLGPDQNVVVTVTQPPDALVWQGQLSPFQYVELTMDSLPLTGGGGSDGLIYIDLSAVDGFFFPAALSTTINSQSLLLGQPWQAYTAPNSTGPNTYAAVSRNEIVGAWKQAFGTTAQPNDTNFPGGAKALGLAYAALLVLAKGEIVGLQNPTFAYSNPGASIPAFDSCWDNALDALFKNTNEIDLTGDIPINNQVSYYKGSQVTVTDINGKVCNAIQFAEYAGGYTADKTTGATGSTGASFWVFDPRTPPATEGQAFVSSGNPMAVGYQVFANTGVFASTALVIGGNSPNYQSGTPAWSAGDALKQLNALQRDIVTALNRGVGGLGIGGTTAGGTTTYWNTETNWYPSVAPFAAQTAQNLFSQWVHTAVIDATKNQYYATYPFGSTSGYGTPVQAAGGSLYMNQTYGFGYDETPNNAANVPSKFLPIANTAGNTATLQLVFGPWK